VQGKSFKYLKTFCLTSLSAAVQLKFIVHFAQISNQKTLNF
jgi:hypothetical protein